MEISTAKFSGWGNTPIRPADETGITRQAMRHPSEPKQSYMPQSLSSFSHVYKLDREPYFFLETFPHLGETITATWLLLVAPTQELKTFPRSEKADKLADTQALFQNNDYEKGFFCLSSSCSVFTYCNKEKNLSPQAPSCLIRPVCGKSLSSAAPLINITAPCGTDHHF